MPQAPHPRLHALHTGPGSPALRAATLYVVATPLGHIGDLSPRARAILTGTPVIAAESVERTRRLLTALGGSHPDQRVLSYRESNRAAATATLLDILAEGRSVALVSDAGTPGISDPGTYLVGAVAAAGFAVVPIPGPSAVITALSVAHFPVAEWTFAGFPARAAGKRRARLTLLRDEGRAFVLFESPRRYRELMEAIAELMPNRPVLVARELTKTFESLYRGLPGELLHLDMPGLGSDGPGESDDSESEEVRGELTIIVGGAVGVAGAAGEWLAGEREAGIAVGPGADAANPAEGLWAAAVERVREGEPMKPIAAELARALQLKKSVVYRHLLDRSGKARADATQTTDAEADEPPA
jgi:16S rRNA (cytidine1402-2'-O)-methyltransferase